MGRFVSCVVLGQGEGMGRFVSCVVLGQGGETGVGLWVGLFVGCLMSQQHASVSQGLICSDNFTCCHTEIEVADQIFYLTQS